MVLPRTRAFHLTSRRARSLTSSLFGVTFFACILTVSASDMLPCPAHPERGRFADADGDNEAQHPHIPSRHAQVIERKHRRWIEEHRPERV
ncbi:hypothetical protein B0F90DRAFT_1942057 [Multifurca ochricompacta]|uniref:Uncharacterized protein n=1 Tax=Multifurca ochricompacta TaxID=376703 RepID=A0AAD4LXF4_9AGAM|nr:hypothetical protein B0F90DRAFT_1942057 [Multifurca ochricompacta]